MFGNLNPGGQIQSAPNPHDRKKMFILFAVRNRCNELQNSTHSQKQAENSRSGTIPVEIQRPHMLQLPAVDGGVK